MFHGEWIASSLVHWGFTHVIWIPDSTLGVWEDALRENANLKLIRPAREGEAVAIAAGLMLANQKPLVMMQCTGFFEAGDSIRNVVHDLELPLKMLVGVRSYHQRAVDGSEDNCPKYASKLVKAWTLKHDWLFDQRNRDDLAKALEKLSKSPKAHALLLGE